MYVGKYKDVKRETRKFQYGKHNAVCVMTGENYHGLILVDIDYGDDVFDKWNDLLIENGADSCDTLQSETINQGMHYYFYCTKEQRKVFSEMAFTSSNNKLFDISSIRISLPLSAP